MKTMMFCVRDLSFKEVYLLREVGVTVTKKGFINETIDQVIYGEP